jgi:hypothetical protein
VQLEDQYIIKDVQVVDLFAFMVLLEDIVALNGIVLLKKGHELTSTLIEKLRLMDKTYGIKQPIKVLIPPKELIEKRRKALKD